jgi:uncharacterized Zn-finger protein
MEEEKKAPVEKPWVCKHCPSSFTKKYNLNKHVKQVHSGCERKHMRHIKKDKKVVCPVCAKEFTHSSSLKKHIIKNHQSKDLEDKGVKVVDVTGPLVPIKPRGPPKTDLQEIKLF